MGREGQRGVLISNLGRIWKLSGIQNTKEQFIYLLHSNLLVLLTTLLTPLDPLTSRRLTPWEL
jgi:hypothetical protein